MYYNLFQYIPIYYNLLCCIVLYCVTWRIYSSCVIHYNTTRCNTIYYNTIPRKVTQYITIPFQVTQYITIQFCFSCNTKEYRK